MIDLIPITTYNHAQMNKLIRILCILLIASMPVMAQEEELGVEGPTLGDVPIDGGLSLLLAAGAAYGGRRLHRKRNGRKQAKA